MTEKPKPHSRRRHLAAWALLAGLFGPDVGPRQQPSKKLRARSWSRPHQGAQECARRRAKIESGQIPSSQVLRGRKAA